LMSMPSTLAIRAAMEGNLMSTAFGDHVSEKRLRATGKRLESPFYRQRHRLEWTILSLRHRDDTAMARSGDSAYWRDLESHAHLPDVQELIREEIQRGTIRVRPTPDGGIRIMPVRPGEAQNRGDRTSGRPKR
jgi:hypothetical protein